MEEQITSLMVTALQTGSEKEGKMKTFTYENQGQETLLVYHLDEEEHLDSFAKGMLQSNEIVGILRPSFVSGWGLLFEISSDIQNSFGGLCAKRDEPDSSAGILSVLCLCGSGN